MNEFDGQKFDSWKLSNGYEDDEEDPLCDCCRIRDWLIMVTTDRKTENLCERCAANKLEEKEDFLF